MITENPKPVAEKCVHEFVDGESMCLRECGAMNYKIIGGRAYCGNCEHDWTEYVHGWASGNFNPKAATHLECPVCKSQTIIFQSWLDEAKQ